MQYGLIGEHLPHSFSKEIHTQIGAYAYELCELMPNEVVPFLQKRDFRGINVTIPYKQTVIPHLDEIDPKAEQIGAVNTVVNRDGRLCGYNTDFDGMRLLLQRMQLSLQGKKVLILGTGGTSRTAMAVAQAMGAAEIYKVSRHSGGDAITYETAVQQHSDAQVILNTTPCGMYPEPDKAPLYLSAFFRLEGVLDAIYNPLRTCLVQQALQMGAKASGGLYMLVAQAVCAAEHFLGHALDEALTERIFARIERQKENIVLIGMPACGKSTVGKVLARRTGRPLVDVDEWIVQHWGCSIPTLFAQYGESGFRDRESEAVAEIAKQTGIIIATGGGAVLRGENVRALKQNGRLFFLNRPLNQLLPTANRPTANSAEKIQKLFETRLPIYLQTADCEIATQETPGQTALIIERRLAE